MKYLFMVWLLCCALYASANIQLTTEDFGRLPDVSHLQLSPNGQKIASIVRIDVKDTKGTAVELVDIKNHKTDLALFTDNKKYDINWIRWKDDKTLLAGTIYPSRRDTWLGMSHAHFKTRDSRLLIINTETGKVTTPFKKSFLRKYKILPEDMDTVVDILPDDPRHILMLMPTNQSLVDRSFAGVYRVDIVDQTIEKVQGSVDYVYNWGTDQQHRVRVGMYFDYKNGINKTLFKKVGDDDWTEAWPYQEFSDKEVDPIGFGLDPNILYIRAYYDGRMAIFKVDLRDKTLARELVYADPHYDVNGGLVYSPITHDVIGISYSENGGFTFFEPELKHLNEVVNKAISNTQNYIFAFSDDMQKYLVYSNSDIDSGTYYLGDRSKGSLNAVAYRYKKLTPDLMAPVQAYNYKARDGFAIEGFLTLPKGSKGKKLPAIIFPHGGPIGRDDSAFNYWVQFFANKGYAVLQMNFRGSAGQGVAFRNAGLKNWGLEMQDDIQDGAKKLIADGIAKADSICIVGASYGGYAALEGAVKTPDFYHCAISVAGVSNVFELVKDNRAFWRSYNIIDEQIGNDNKHLREISPVNYAAKIKIPVLLIHGDSDRQVDVKHSIEMRDALQKAGKNVTYLELPDEDHYLTDNKNRVAAFKAMSDFLDLYLPVKH